MGSTGLGGMISSTKAYKTDIQALYGIRNKMATGFLDLREYDFKDTTADLKGLSNESRNLLQTWQDNGTTTEQAIKNIDTRIATLGKTSSKVTQYIANIGNTLLNGFVSLGISAAISVVISAINSLANSYKDMVKELGEASSKYTESKTELTGYAKEIEKLRGIMEDEASTTEQVKDATSKLYDIQNKLVATYGGYAAGIDLVNGKLEHQLDIISEIDKKNYQQWENEVTSSKSAKSAATSMGVKTLQSIFLPFLGGVNTAKDYFNFGKELLNGEGLANSFKDSFGGTDVFGKDYGLQIVGNQLEEATNKYENFKASIKATDNATVNQLIDSFEEFSVIGDKIEISGRVDDVADSLETLQVDLRNAGYENKELNKALSKNAKKARETATALSDMYATETYGQILQDKELLIMYDNLEKAYNNYKEATESGDQDAIKESLKALQDNIAIIETSDIDKKYKQYFEDLYPDIQNIVSNWKFEFQLVPTIEDTDFQKFIRDHSLEEIVSEYYKYVNQGLKYNDAKGYAKYFSTLQSTARAAGKDVKELVAELQETEGFAYSSNLDKVKSKIRETSSNITPDESDKISSYGVEKYRKDIETGNLQSKYGNVDMDNRDIIYWNDKNLNKFKEQLQTWGTEFDNQGNMVRSYYDDLLETFKQGEIAIDTVWGGSDEFNWGGEGHEISFTPIMQTDDGAVFLGKDEVYNYISSVIDKAAEDDGIVTADEIFAIDAYGVGEQYGEQFGKGLIAGIDTSTGNGGKSIPAEDVGSLLHFSGDYGAIGITKNNKEKSTPKSLNTRTLSAVDFLEPVTKYEPQNTSQSEEVLDKWFQSLTTEAQEAFNNLDLSEEEIDVLVSFNTDLERSNWLYKMLHEGTTTIEVKTKTTDLVSDLDTFEDKIDSLATAYESAVTNATYVAASDLQSLNDDFGGMKDDDGNYTAMASSIEKFNDTVTQNIGNTDGANQTAVNELLTSYLDLSGTLENLIDEGEDYAKQVLENQGVENAEEVVTSRLNKTYKATRANLVKLTEALNNTTKNGTKFLDVLESGVREGDDFDQTCEGLVKSVSELVGVYNQDTGEFMGGADIDADFVKANIEDIIDAYTGVDGALDKLYEDVAEFNAQKVYIEAGLDDSEIESKMTGISDMLAIASTWTMEPEALLENSQFMEALNACWDGSEETANAINAALSTIGMKVEYKKTPKKITVPTNEATASNSKGTNTYQNGKSTMVYWNTKDITVDDFEIVSTPTGKGTTGSNANYTGSPSSSSNSGGSGDGSDSSSDSEETFDWIEVAIDRLENNLDKLGETVDSTYEKWESRNKAITKSIDEVNREIELQEEGAAEYLKKAESIDLSEDWKKKVREGKIEIDTVSDDTLKTNIQNYQTWLFFSHHTYYMV